MPLDDYASLGGGALRLKGAKVTKKKKRKEKSGLEKALSGGETSVVKAGDEGEKRKAKRKKDDEEREGEREGEDEEEEEERPVVRKTEAERRLEELKRKRVCYSPFAPLPPLRPCPGHWARVLLWRCAVLTVIVPRNGREPRSQTRAPEDAQGEG